MNVFNAHYSAIMRYLKRGPFLVDAHMHSPLVLARRAMDALQTFWPGLQVCIQMWQLISAQVLKGDVDAAMEIFELYNLVHDEHGFIPESFTAVSAPPPPLRALTL